MEKHRTICTVRLHFSTPVQCSVLITEIAPVLVSKGSVFTKLQRVRMTSSSTTSGPPKSFLCPHCDKRMWRSIETFRVHKAHCRTRGATVEPEPRHYCADCQAAFKTSQEYRNHIRGLADKKDERSHQTRVCSLHCGSAFSQTSCLQHHSVECFAKQTMGPFNVIICKDN